MPSCLHQTNTHEHKETRTHTAMITSEQELKCKSLQNHLGTETHGNWSVQEDRTPNSRSMVMVLCITWGPTRILNSKVFGCLVCSKKIFKDTLPWSAVQWHARKINDLRAFHHYCQNQKSIMAFVSTIHKKQV